MAAILVDEWMSSDAVEERYVIAKAGAQKKVDDWMSPDAEEKSAIAKAGTQKQVDDWMSSDAEESAVEERKAN